ncbi:MAG: hypothetical protein Q8L19_23900 [Reyranella sp.]|nr:hypothetical protein [Reyranella sp.]
MAASLIFASPMAVAVHDSFTLHEDSASLLAESDRDHSQGRDGSGDQVTHQHDRATADHGHEAGGTVVFQIAERPAILQPWQSAKPEFVDPGTLSSLERPPRSGTTF